MHSIINSVFKNKRWLVFSFLSPLIIIVVIPILNLSKLSIALLLCAPILTILLFNFEWLLILSVLLLYIFFGYEGIMVVSIISIPLLLSHFIVNNNSIKGKLDIPFKTPFFIYLLCILPSFYNTSDLMFSIKSLFNILSMCLFTYLIGKHVNGYHQIKKLIVVFLLVAFFNGMHIIYQSRLTDRRVFGFCGVVFVDYACIVLLIILTIILYYSNFKAIKYVFLFLFFFAALSLTQTRNTVLSFLFTLFTGGILFLLKPANININKRKIIYAISFTIVSGVIIFAILTIFLPEAFDRFSELFTKKSIKIGDANDFGQSSLITRLLIWHTSLQAFLAHPFIGIGYNSFVVSSKNYFIIPNELYKLFVKGCSPHVAYLAVITETGIIGLIGFLNLLYSIIKMTLKSVSLSATRQEWFFSFGILLLQIYIVISMAMTDAWLWGQCGSLWGIILGVSLANYNMLKKNDNSSKPSYLSLT